MAQISEESLSNHNNLRTLKKSIFLPYVTCYFIVAQDKYSCLCIPVYNLGCGRSNIMYCVDVHFFSCVYKCVCKQFSERLYRDLLHFISTHLAGVNTGLQECVSKQFAILNFK